MSERKFIVTALASLRPRMVQAFRAVEQMVKAGIDVEVIVRERKSKRSAEQNRRYWALLREVAATVWVDGRQFSDEVWHEQCRRTFIGMEEIAMPDGTITVRGISTTTLDVAAFGQYMERIEQWCAEQGYPVMEVQYG